MTKAQLETAIRNMFLDFIREMVTEKLDTDALDVSASELAIPCLDKEGNEKWALIKVSIPRGTREKKALAEANKNLKELRKIQVTPKAE